MQQEFAGPEPPESSQRCQNRSASAWKATIRVQQNSRVSVCETGKAGGHSALLLSVTSNRSQGVHVPDIPSHVLSELAGRIAARESVAVTACGCPMASKARVHSLQSPGNYCLPSDLIKAAHSADACLK
jgi:hypothetical protein